MAYSRVYTAEEKEAILRKVQQIDSSKDPNEKHKFAKDADNMSLDEFASMAKASGMTYGQMQAHLYRMRSTH